ncbi:MAP/microtubule affinity-regulating kinase 3 isoform 1 [Schistosoma japonicum]|uniref:MAP/microtubule affinity-regulating kinase 3 n=1 Tax=Schistosoma japonicum TaxID=6182 RepID=C1LDX5_SCHJA|nr:MAP/microtubule affinity-regulating kinase 3 isoform 1 [Schistosoma japonicum]CAX72903.1 MAP/microtubule affinity-regulating kinase 3 [Schistosoma japonicum]
MPKIEYIGRPSLHFYGKLLSEIARNLKNRAKGRVVIKVTESAKFKEPCYYILENVIPLMSDQSGVRCRAWGRRIFRGRNLGCSLLPNTHEPDWRLLSPSEAEHLMSLSTKADMIAPDVPVNCLAQAPPLLTIFLRRRNIIPPQVVKETEENTHPLTMQQSMREGSGLLLLTPHRYDPTSFKVPIEPTPEEKSRMYPPYEWSSQKGLIIKPNLNRDTYLIRRSDTPGLYWRVHLNRSSETGSDISEAS